MAEAYGNWDNFRDWMAEDIFQRTYQDYLVDSRDAIALHENDPDAPEWAKGMAVDAELQEIAAFPRRSKGKYAGSGNGGRSRNRRFRKIRRTGSYAKRTRHI